MAIRMTKIGWKLLVLGLVSLVVASCSEERSVPVVYPTRGDLVGRFLASGHLESPTIGVATENFGQLTSIEVEVNQPVKKGQVLAVMEDADREAQVKSLRSQVATALSQREEALQQVLLKRVQIRSDEASAAAHRRQAELELAGASRGPTREELAQAEASVEEAKVRLEQARRERERLEQLFEDKVVSQAALEKARTNEQLALVGRTRAVNELAQLKKGPPAETVAAAQQKVAIADVNLDRAQNADLEVALLESKLQTRELELQRLQSELSAAEERYARSRLKAPVDGIVSRVHKEVGETVYAGHVIVSLVQTDRLWIEASVAEQDASNVTQGQQVDIRFPSLPEKTMVGTVEEVAPSLESREGSPGNARFLRVRVALQGDLSALRPGIEADIEGTRALAKDVLLVPRGTVLKNDQSPYVVAVRGGTVTRIPVKLGASTPETLEVEGPIDQKTAIVSLGAERLSEGQKVKIADAK